MLSQKSYLLKLKYLLLALLCGLFSFYATGQNKESYLQIKEWKKFRLNPDTYCCGSVYFPVNKNGMILYGVKKYVWCNVLRKVPMDFFPDMKNFVCITKQEKEDAEKFYETHEVGGPDITEAWTNVLVSKRIVSYTVIRGLSSSVASIPNQYFNFDLKTLQPIILDSLVKPSERKAFKYFLKKYAQSCKANIVADLSWNDDRGIFAQANYAVLHADYYTIKDVEVSVESLDFSHFGALGIVFSVDVTDRNFLKAKDYPGGALINKHSAYLSVPYDKILKFFDKKRGLYPSLVGLKNAQYINYL